jgi:hypothetical protein
MLVEDGFKGIDDPPFLLNGMAYLFDAAWP